MISTLWRKLSSAYRRRNPYIGNSHDEATVQIPYWVEANPSKQQKRYRKVLAESQDRTTTSESKALRPGLLDLLDEL
ncbi:MAG: hypothetical protein JSW00_09005 [Thermoplasmata archaeon]|nr:MAG: hypothetical protein JSW00_09005 [Thermoplasmata archaeon]